MSDSEFTLSDSDAEVEEVEVEKVIEKPKTEKQRKADTLKSLREQIKTIQKTRKQPTELQKATRLANLAKGRARWQEKRRLAGLKKKKKEKPSRYELSDSSDTEEEIILKPKVKKVQKRDEKDEYILKLQRKLKKYKGRSAGNNIVINSAPPAVKESKKEKTKEQIKVKNDLNRFIGF